MKNTIAGILSAIIGICTSLLAYQVPVALMTPNVTHDLLWMNMALNLTAIVARVIIGVLMNDAPAPPINTSSVVKMFVIFAALSFMALGCHAQVPPSTNSVALTWTAPVTPACTAGASCTYVISRAAALTATTCPANTATNYTPLNQGSPSAVVSYNDTSASGTVCYIAQTVQGGLISFPSAASNVVTVPLLPGAPSIPAIGAVSEEKPLSIPNMGISAPSILRASLVR